MAHKYDHAWTVIVPEQRRERRIDHDQKVTDVFPSTEVTVTISGRTIEAMMMRAARAKSRKCQSGPAVAKAKKGTK